MRSEIRKLEDITREQLVKLLIGIARFHEEFGVTRRKELPGEVSLGNGLQAQTVSGNEFILVGVMKPVKFEVVEVEGNPEKFDSSFTYSRVTIKLVPNTNHNSVSGYPLGVGRIRQGSFDLLPVMYNIIDRALGIVPETEVREAVFFPEREE